MEGGSGAAGRGAGLPAAVEPVVPDGRLEIVLHLAEPFGTIDEDGMIRRQAKTLVAGQLTRAIHLTPTGPARIVGIRFRTASARAVLGLPIHELTDRILPLRDVAPELAEAAERAAQRMSVRCDAPTAPDATADLEQVLLARIGEVAGARIGRVPYPVSEAAVIRLSNGTGVAGVARSLGVSERTLERWTRENVGLPPKLLQRVMRFRRFYGLLQEGSPPSMAQAAIAAGYYDQAHANRDFRAFTGAAPTAHFASGAHLAGALLSDSS